MKDVDLSHLRRPVHIKGLFPTNAARVVNASHISVVQSKR